MDILPAIDLRDGKCVRLLQGDYQRQINYHDDPLAQALFFQEQGAKWLHMVDLDGALHGKLHNRAVIEKIVSNTDLKVQLGGGIRDESTVEQLLDMGLSRVVVGTRAMQDRTWFEKLVFNPRFAGRIVLGLDARDSHIATHGWTQTGSLTITEMAQIVNDWPLAGIVYTDIACDGMLTGPNIESTKHLAETCKVPVIASGGIGNLTHIEQLVALPILGIIVGRALYEKNFSLTEALKIVAA